MTNFVPLPVRRAAGTFRVQKNQTLAGILEGFGQPLSAYRELVGANLHKPLQLGAMPDGQAATFAALHEGEVLYLPWSWMPNPLRPRPPLWSALGGSPGMIGDEVYDLINTFNPYANVPPAVKQAGYGSHLHGELNAVLAAWWRQDHPGGAKPKSIADLTPYMSVLGLAQYWGLSLPPDTLAGIPWGEVRWKKLAQAIQAGFPLALVDWQAVNTFLVTYVKPGQFLYSEPPPNWKAATFKPAEVWNFGEGATASWGQIPWTTLSKIRWDLMPWAFIQFGQYKATDNPTLWLLSRIQSAVQTQSQGQAQADLLPTGTPPMPGLPCLGPGGPGFYNNANECVPANTPTGGAVPPGTPPGGIPSLPGSIPGLPGGLPAYTLPGFPGVPIDPAGCGAGKIKINGVCVDATTMPTPPGGAAGCPPGSTLIPGPNGQSFCVPTSQIPGGLPGGFPGTGGGPGGGGPATPQGNYTSQAECDAKEGPGYTFDPVRKICAKCGPNAQYNFADGGCDCLPGFKYEGGPAGTGCVPINGTQQPSCPPGQVWGGTSVGCVATGVVPGTNEKKDEGMSTGAKVGIAVAIAAALAALVAMTRPKKRAA